MNYNGKEVKVTCTSYQDPINNIESGNFNGITADELLQYFGHVYKSKYNEKYTANYDDKKILEDNIKRFGVEETACRIDKLIYNYETISGGSSKFPRPYVRQLNIYAKNPWISDKLQDMERVVKNTSFNNEKGREDFFSMSMEEFDAYIREVKERYKDEIKALEEADAKLQEEENKIKNNIDRLVNHFKQEYKNKYNKDYNPTDREIEALRIVVVDRYSYTIEQWEGIISTFINSYDENWKSDKSPEPRMGDNNYALVREWVTKRVYNLFVCGLKEKDTY